MLVTSQNWEVLFFVLDVIKIPFIDFPPLFSSSSGASVVAIDNKIEQAMVCTDEKSFVLNVGTVRKARLGWNQCIHS